MAPGICLESHSHLIGRIRSAEALHLPTQKVEKYILRQQGITEDTWDRVKAGVEIKRQKIG